MFKIVAVLLSLLYAQNVLAHAWVLNAPLWSRSHAEAHVPGNSQVTDSGVVFGQTNATAVAAGLNAFAFAHARSIGLWGGTARALAFGQGAWAGPEQPFNEPINPSSGSGDGELTFQGVRSSNWLNLSGASAHNPGGYLELAVLNIDGLTEDYVSNIFLVHGSVESALTAGYISSDRVLFSRRETDLNSSFSYQVDIDNLDNEDILVSGLAHAASVPEPSTLALLGIGGGLLVASRRRAKTALS